MTPTTTGDRALNGAHSRRRPGRLRVLTYHQVASPSELRGLADPRGISATPEAFRRQMRYVARHCSVVSIDAVLAAITEGRPLPRRAVLLTFDDAYADFLVHVWPILRELRLPAVMFVPTAYPGHPERAFWWDRIYRSLLHTTKTETPPTPVGTFALTSSDARRRAIRSLQDFANGLPYDETLAFTDEVCKATDERPVALRRVLDWDDLRLLARHGVAIAGHTQTHATLDGVSPERARAEIVGAQSDIAREIGQSLPVFCYPRGSYTQPVVDILRQEHFVAAFTTISGQNDLGAADPLLLRRQNVSLRTTPFVLALRVTRIGGKLDHIRLG